MNDGCSGGTCSGGSCVPNGVPLPAGTACDSDANACTLETCDGSGSCGTCDATYGCLGNEGGCGVTPSTPSSIVLKTGSDPKQKKVVWKWKGLAGTIAQFGDPTTTTDYTLCVYENAPNQPPVVILRAVAPAGGMCGTRPCWTAKTTGFTYKDSELTPDGVASVKLKAGTALSDETVLGVKGKGALLPLPQTTAKPYRSPSDSRPGGTWKQCSS